MPATPVFDLDAATAGMMELLRTIPNMKLVVDGAPEWAETAEQTWVMTGDLDFTDGIKPIAAGGAYEMTINLIVTLGYLVAGAEAQAESRLRNGITELTRRLIQNRRDTVTGNGVTVTPMLNGSVVTFGLPKVAASPSDYIYMAGQEVRAYWLAVPIRQRELVLG